MSLIPVNKEARVGKFCTGRLLQRAAAMFGPVGPKASKTAILFFSARIGA